MPLSATTGSMSAERPTRPVTSSALAGSSSTKWCRSQRPGDVRTKFEPMWSCGIWLGRHDTSNEHLVGTKFGTLSARCVRRMPSDLQKEKKGYLLDEMIGQPWDTKGAREPEIIRHRPQKGPEPVMGRATEGRAPKTEGCYACRTGHRNHNNDCKKARAD